jgi:hypothetical protein
MDPSKAILDLCVGGDAVYFVILAVKFNRYAPPFTGEPQLTFKGSRRPLSNTLPTKDKGALKNSVCFYLLAILSEETEIVEVTLLDLLLQVVHGNAMVTNKKSF